jgi:hypothetical protein
MTQGLSLPTRTGLHEGEDADPELVVTGAGLGGGAEGLELAAERVIDESGEAGFGDEGCRLWCLRHICGFQQLLSSLIAQIEASLSTLDC